MCIDLSIEFECFCDSRVIEILNKNNNNNITCECFKVKNFKLVFGWCKVCHEKIIQNRIKFKNILLSCQRKNFFNMYYHNSVSFYVQQEIKM